MLGPLRWFQEQLELYNSRVKDYFTDETYFNLFTSQSDDSKGMYDEIAAVIRAYKTSLKKYNEVTLKPIKPLHHGNNRAFAEQESKKSTVILATAVGRVQDILFAYMHTLLKDLNVSQMPDNRMWRTLQLSILLRHAVNATSRQAADIQRCFKKYQSLANDAQSERVTQILEKYIEETNKMNPGARLFDMLEYWQKTDKLTRALINDLHAMIGSVEKITEKQCRCAQRFLHHVSFVVETFSFTALILNQMENKKELPLTALPTDYLAPRAALSA